MGERERAIIQRRQRCDGRRGRERQSGRETDGQTDREAESRQFNQWPLMCMLSSRLAPAPDVPITHAEAPPSTPSAAGHPTMPRAREVLGSNFEFAANMTERGRWLRPGKGKAVGSGDGKRAPNELGRGDIGGGRWKALAGVRARRREGAKA